MDRRSALKSAGILAGTALATPSLLSLLQACKNTPRLEWQPLFFTEAEALLVGALADTLLPRTETPGALDVKADLFIDTLIARAYPPEAQQYFRSELERFDADCLAEHGTGFAGLDPEGRKAVLTRAEQEAGTFSRGVWGTPVGEQKPVGFYRSFKSLAIWAYFSSEEIGENVLSYDPIPGAYHGCIPVAEVGNRWSL